MQHTTVGWLLRSSQSYCSQLCDKDTLEYGIAYYSARFSTLNETNQFREVVAEESEWDQALAEAQEWFQRHGLLCRRWATASGDAGERPSRLLMARGFRRRVYHAMMLTRWVQVSPSRRVRVLPARAMRLALRQTFPGDSTSDQPAACEQRLDDAPFDMFVAMVEGRPAGRCALYQVGDIGRVMDLCVSDSTDRSIVEQALTAHVLALAKRLALRNICVQVDGEDSRLRAFYETFGFVSDGTIVEFDRDETLPGGP